jgi:hypothetical protein
MGGTMMHFVSLTFSPPSSSRLILLGSSYTHDSLLIFPFRSVSPYLYIVSFHFDSHNRAPRPHNGCSTSRSSLRSLPSLKTRLWSNPWTK